MSPVKKPRSRAIKPRTAIVSRVTGARPSSVQVFPSGKKLVTITRAPRNITPPAVRTKEGHVIKPSLAAKVMTAAVGVGLFRPLWSYDVTSSNIKSIQFDPFRHEMRIRFLNESLYAYYNVPLNEFLGLMAATSHGHYFWEHMRKPGLLGSKEYEYAKVE